MVEDDKKDEGAKKIGEYLVNDQVCIDRLLKKQRERPGGEPALRFGELLIDEGVVTREELCEALQKQRYERLLSCPLFQGASDRELVEISKWVMEVDYGSGEEFIRQDDFGDCFYVMVCGRALVYRIGDYGEEVPLAFIDPGESIGEMGYFADGRRTASVRALDECQLLRMNYMDLKNLFQVAPTLSKNFLDLVTARLRRTNLRFQDLTEKSLLTERSLDNLRRFLDMSEISALSQGIEGLIERVVVTASKVLAADRATLFLVDVHTGELWSKVAEGLKSREIRIPLGKGVAGWVAVHDELVNIPDAYRDPRFDPTADKITGYITKNIMCGPVKNLQGEIVGVIQAINKKRGIFDDRDEDLFRAFSYQTAIAVENFRLYRRLVSNHEQMAILLDVANAVSQTIDLDDLILEIVNKISDILETERSTLFLLEGDELWSKAALGHEVTEIRFPKHMGLAGFVAETGQILNIDDAYRDRRFNPEVDRESGYKTRNVLSVPVINRNGDIIGVTQAINKKAGRFEAEDEMLLKALSSQIAVSLENARLHRAAVNMKNYLASVQDSITNSIITLDRHYRVVTANRASYLMFEPRMGSLLDLDFREVLGADNQRLREHIDWVYRNQRALVDYDLDLVLSSGKKHVVNANFVALVQKNEERTGLVLVFEDITREKRIKGAMTRYMAKDIVDRLLEDPSHQALGGASGRASIMFADIRGFTGIAEGLSAVETVEFLNEYFSLMVDVVFDNGGVLDKYIGDAIMAVFGVPYPQKDDPVRAVLTTLQMRSVLADINKRRQADGLEPISIGMGICTGEVVSGNIGSERRMDYTVVGDEVNIAARLEALTRVYGVDILINEATHQEIKGHFTTRPIDIVLFKGKKHPVKVFEVLGDSTVELCEANKQFCRGLEYYQQKNFDEAARIFAAGRGDDRVCRVYLERCRYFLKNPPPEDWKGVWYTEDK